MQSIFYGRTEKIFQSQKERKDLIEYTKKAIDFAEYISFDKKNEIFEMLGVMPAAYPDKENEDLMAVYEQYNNSRIISKEVENSEILSELEIILRRVWSGENISDVIKEYE